MSFQSQDTSSFQFQPPHLHQTQPPSGAPTHLLPSNPNKIPVSFDAGDALRLALQSTPVMSMPQERDRVIYLRSTDTLSTAMTLLNNYRIQACPVWDDEIGSVIGMLSVNDLVAEILQIADIVAPGFKPKLDQEKMEDAIRLVDMQEMWAKTSALAVANLSKKNPVVALRYDATMWDVVLKLAVDGYHSVVIKARDDDGICAVISQSLVLKVLFQHLDKFPTIARKTVQQVVQLNRVPAPEIVSVMEDQLTIDAFRKIVTAGVSGIAVLNHHRKIIGVISASDIRMVAPDAGLNVLLYVTAGEFIKRTQSLNSLIVAPVVSVTAIDTVGIVMEKMIDNGIHRLFVVRTHHGMEENVLVDVISLRDVLLQFVPRK